MNQYFNIKTGVSNVTSSDGNQYFNVKKSSIWDKDAVLYLDNSGIFDEDIRLNYNDFVIELKSGGVYHLIDILYPDLGEDANQNKLNAINPIDDDSAFRRTFHGGVTFDKVNGTKGNGINGYYDTKYIPRDNVNSSTGGGIVLGISGEKTVYQNYRVDIGSIGSGSGDGIYIQTQNASNQSTSRCYTSGNNYNIISNVQSTIGIYATYRFPNSNKIILRKNGFELSLTSTGSMYRPTRPIVGLCWNNGGSPNSFVNTPQVGVIVFKNAEHSDIIKMETALQ